MANPSGWAGWGLGSRRMQGTNTVIVKASASSSTGETSSLLSCVEVSNNLQLSQGAGVVTAEF